MTKLTLTLTGLIVAGSLLAPVAQAQTAASPSGPAARQRAPGVPLSPRPADVARLKADERGPAQLARRDAADERAVRNPDRDLPMPRGVPSIIAPSR